MTTMIDSTGVLLSANVPANEVMYAISASSIKVQARVLPLGELNKAFHRTCQHSRVNSNESAAPSMGVNLAVNGQSFNGLVRVRCVLGTVQSAAVQLKCPRLELWSGLCQPLCTGAGVPAFRTDGSHGGMMRGRVKTEHDQPIGIRRAQP